MSVFGHKNLQPRLRRKRTLVLAWAIAAATAALTPAQTPAPSRGDVTLRATRLLDPVSGQIRGPLVIQVSGGRITKILPANEVDARSGTVIDLGNATVLPGLIDAHVHLQIGGEPQANATAILRAGFTTVVDLGARSDVVLRLRDQIAAGTAEGPRILAAGLWVGTKAGVCEFGGIGIAGSPDAFRARVRENIAAGADLIKVCVSGWAADGFARPDSYEIADDALAAVVDESRRADRMVVAHAISAGGVKAALRAGVRGLAHAAYVDKTTAEELRTHGVFLVPTLTSLLAGTQGPAAEALRTSVTTAYRAGVRIVFGTDGGVLPHGQNAKELTTLVDAGLSPIDAIRAATVHAAGAFGLADTIGSIEPGRAADIIAVDGDPLADVTSLSRVVFVMHDGRIVRRPR